MTSAAPPSESNSQNRAARGIVFLTVFIDLLGFGMVLPLLPIYADQFVVDESGLEIGLLMASFSAMQFLFAPMWGRLSDRIGRRPVPSAPLRSASALKTALGLSALLLGLQPNRSPTCL